MPVTINEGSTVMLWKLSGDGFEVVSLWKLLTLCNTGNGWNFNVELSVKLETAACAIWNKPGKVGWDKSWLS
jgi:hypothetical protein